jgi:hypothetical protein
MDKAFTHSGLTNHCMAGGLLIDPSCQGFIAGRDGLRPPLTRRINQRKFQPSNEWININNFNLLIGFRISYLCQPLRNCRGEYERGIFDDLWYQ